MQIQNTEFKEFRDPSLSSGCLGFLHSSVGKESACSAGDPGSITVSGRSPGEGIGYPFLCTWAPLVAQLVKNLPAMRETWVQSLGWEDPLEKGKAIPTPIFWPGEFLGLYSPWGHKESDMTEWLWLVCVIKSYDLLFRWASDFFMWKWRLFLKIKLLLIISLNIFLYSCKCFTNINSFDSHRELWDGYCFSCSDVNDAISGRVMRID